MGDPSKDTVANEPDRRRLHNPQDKDASSEPASRRFVAYWFQTGERAALFLMLSPFLVLYYFGLTVTESAQPVKEWKLEMSLSSWRPGFKLYLALAVIVPFATGLSLAPLVWCGLGAAWATQHSLLGTASA